MNFIHHGFYVYLIFIFMASEFTIRGKKVSVWNNGTIYVNGDKTNLQQWSGENRYSDPSGREIKELAGKSLEEVLYIKGYIPRK